FDLTSLDVSNNLALRILDVSQNSLTELDLSNNILLEELYCGNPIDDVWPQNEIVHIDLSHNPNIHMMWAENMFSLLNGGINLANGNNETAMHINVLRSGMDWTDDTPICIQVDDAQTAINGSSPYSDWTVIGGHFYSQQTCTLNVSAFDKNEINIYPNPALDWVYFENLDSNTTLNILDFTGKLVYSIQPTSETLQISTSSFSKGIYLVQLLSPEQTIVKKLVLN